MGIDIAFADSRYHRGSLHFFSRKVQKADKMCATKNSTNNVWGCAIMTSRSSDEELLALSSLSLAHQGDEDRVNVEELTEAAESHSQPEQLQLNSLTIQAEVTLSYRDALLKNEDSLISDSLQEAREDSDRKRLRTWPKPKIVVKQVKREKEEQPSPAHEIDVFDGAEEDGMADIWYRLNVDKLSQVLTRSRSNLSIKQKAQKEKRIAAK